jgi:mono/diheme cytochrome c family protein
MDSIFIRSKTMMKTVLAVMGLAMAFLLVSTLDTLRAQGDAAARGLVQERCAACHNLGRVKRNIGKNDAQAWDALVDRMQKKGARVTDAERAIMAQFLASLESGDDL